MVQTSREQVNATTEELDRTMANAIEKANEAATVVAYDQLHRLPAREANVDRIGFGVLRDVA